MGRPPSNGGPSFRFNPVEIAEMEAILQAHRIAMPAREVLVALAEKFSNSEERKGKIEVQMKQVWNWFQNRRYAIRAKAGKSPGKLNVPQMTRDDPTMVKGVPQATQPHAASSATVRSLPQVPQHPTVPSAAVRTFPQAPQNTMSFSVQSAGRVADNSQMEYEAKSARDGAWYDVSTFLSHRSLETGDPEVMVRFAGFGAEEDEWVNVRKNVRQRSLPCEASECVAVLPADLILCFQEGKEQALYFDAHVLDAQRRRHDVRGCRCRFLVRYDHDQSEEIVALRKICRRPETDYRLQQLHAVNESLSANQNKNGTNNIHTVSTLRVYPPAEVQPKQLKAEPTVVVPPPSLAETPSKRQKVETAAPTSPLETTTVLAAQPVDVPQDQQKVQAAPSPVVELAAQPVDVPQDHQKVQAASTPVVEPVLPSPVPSVEPSVEPQKVEPVVPVASAQDSMEVEKAGSIAPTGSDEVALELHKVQPVMPDPSGEVSREPEAMGAVVPPSTATETPVEPPHEGELEVAQPQEELMVHSSSAEVQTKLPELQPASAVEAVETKAEVPVELPEAQPATALEAVETKADVQAEMPEIQPISALEAGETKDEVSVEMSEVQPASAVEAIETKHEVQVELPKSAGETKDEVQVESPEVQTASALETGEAKHEVPVELPEEQPASALEAIRTKDEVQVELPEVQPASAPEAGETKDEVPAELSEAQPANPLEEMETKAEVPEVLPEVQPASKIEAVETKAEVPEELHEVQPASALEAVETKAEVPEEFHVVQPATASDAIETKVDIPAALPEVQPASGVEAIETKAEVSEELSEGQPSNAHEAKAEEPMVPVSTDDSNVVEEAMGMDVEEPVRSDNTNDVNVVEAEVEEPKDLETMDIDDRNEKEDEHANNDKVGNTELRPVTNKDDMEEV